MSVQSLIQCVAALKYIVTHNLPLCSIVTTAEIGRQRKRQNKPIKI